MTNKLSIGNIISWLFCIIVFAIGILNSFWGNDPGFGVFLIILSFVYCPPANDILTKKTRFRIPVIAKIVLGLFILWAALGVGELFAKIDLMRMDLFY